MALSIDLTGRVALVTGGVRGIGAGIAAVLADAGATVYVCSRSPVVEERADDAAPVVEVRADDAAPVVEVRADDAAPVVEVRADGAAPVVEVRADGAAPVVEVRAQRASKPPTHIVCDVRDPGAVDAMIDAILAEAGSLDILVNNAGGAPSAEAATASPRFHEKIVGLNLLAPLLVAQAANAVMQQQPRGGSIVNISSISAHRAAPTIAAYGAAKAGLDSLTRSLAMEWGPRVRVNAIDVGLCRTEQTDDHYGSDERVVAIERTIPLGRMADPLEVGRVAAFLASDLASYVSGARLACDGGGEPPVFLHID